MFYPARPAPSAGKATSVARYVLTGALRRIPGKARTMRAIGAFKSASQQRPRGGEPPLSPAPMGPTRPPPHPPHTNPNQRGAIRAQRGLDQFRGFYGASRLVSVRDGFEFDRKQIIKRKAKPAGRGAAGSQACARRASAQHQSGQDGREALIRAREQRDRCKSSHFLNGYRKTLIFGGFTRKTLTTTAKAKHPPRSG